MESPADKVARLKLMSSEDSGWDLSDNDIAAIGWALERITELERAQDNALESARVWCEAHEDLRVKLVERTQERDRLLDTVCAIAVRGLGLPDPGEDGAPVEPPAGWREGFLSERVFVMRQERDALAAALEIAREYLSVAEEYRIHSITSDLCEVGTEARMCELRNDLRAALNKGPGGVTLPLDAPSHADPTDPDEQEQFQKFWGHAVSAHQDKPLSIGDAYRLKDLLYRERFGLLGSREMIPASRILGYAFGHSDGGEVLPNGAQTEKAEATES